MSDCIKCGHYAPPDSKFCQVHQPSGEGPPYQVSEKTQLKREARYLRGQIRKGKALLRQREKVAQLRNVLAEVKLSLGHMQRF